MGPARRSTGGPHMGGARAPKRRKIANGSRRAASVLELVQHLAAAGHRWRCLAEGRPRVARAHEGAVLDVLGRQAAPVPNLVAFDGRGRILLDHVAGKNQWTAHVDRLVSMVGVLVGIQAEWAGKADAIATLGVHDWQHPAFVAAAADTVTSWSARLPASAAAALQQVVDGLGTRFAAIEACGVPDTLLHGDFHPGNFRSDDTSLVLLDWGDCGFGHALLDMAGFLETIDAGCREAVERRWLSAWSNLCPGSDPDRAAELVRPLAALRRAAVYHRFLETFEPSERPYHESDVPRWLLTAAAADVTPV